MEQLRLLGRIAALVGVCLVMLGCQALTNGVIPATEMTLTVSNATSKVVDLVVNGQLVKTIGSSTSVDVRASEMPSLPWAAEVRLPGGRTLVALTVHAGDVWSKGVANGGTELHGDAARVDLSCGRIDMYAGPPLMGPAPGSGVPGDCDP